MQWRMLAICSPINQQAIKSAITAWSLDVTWCLTLQEGRHSLRRGSHTLVLCEAELPDGTYQEAISLLKHKADQIRIIVVAGSHSEEDYRRAIELGAFDVISTPFSRIDLQWIIMQAIQGHPALREKSSKGGLQAGRRSLVFA
jgi:DNA-binding response OmpR family regulator